MRNDLKNNIYSMYIPRMTGLSATIPLARENPLDGLTLYEPIDPNLLQKCINSSLLKENYKDEKWFANEKTQLEHYAENISRNLAKVEYIRNKDYDIGRVLPKGSLGLHSINRRTRHTLVNGVMRDVDIENAHPVLLLQILKHHNYENITELDDYCNNREEWRTIIKEAYDLENNYFVKVGGDDGKSTTKEIAKDLIIRIMYGGTLNKWKTSWKITTGTCPPKVVKLINDIKNIQLWVCEKNPDLFNKCVKVNDDKIKKGEKKYSNPQGTTTSWFLQDKESLVLENMYQYCIDNEYIKDDIAVLCNDGIMLEDRNYKPELLVDLSRYIKEQLGFDLKYTEKALDEGYGDILDNNLKFDLWRMDKTDGMYADYFKLLYCDKFLVKNGFSFHYNGVYWEKDETKKHIKINNFVDNQFKTYIVKRTFKVKSKVDKDMNDYSQKKFLDKDNKVMSPKLPFFEDKYKMPCPPLPENFKGDLVLFYLGAIVKRLMSYLNQVDKYLRNVGSRDCLVKDICRVCNSEWILLDRNEYLVGFLNKIYDLRLGCWIKPHYTQYVSLTTGWKWVSGYSKKYKEDLMRVMEQIHPNKNIRDHYLTVLSTGIFGRVVQHFFVAKGVGGNGKSVINSLMMRTVGSGAGNYGYKMPSTAVGQVIKEGANPAIANLNNKRFTLVQEPDKKHKIACATVKEITGDKELNCRTLYSTDTYVRLTGTLVMECNDLPQLDESGDAIGRRVDVSPFDSKFLTQARWDVRTEEELKDNSIHKANPFYTGDQFQDLYKQALMELLFEYFKKYQENNYIMKPPKEIIKEADEYMKYSDDFYGWWSDKYANKDDEINIIPFSSIWNEFSNSDYYMNMTKKDKRIYNQKKLKDTITTNNFIKDKFYKKGRMYKGVPITADSVCGVVSRYTLYSTQDEIDTDTD